MAAGAVRDRPRPEHRGRSRHGDADLDARHAEAVGDARGRRRHALKELGDAERAAEQEASQWKAREEALALGLRRKDGAGALLAAADRVPGLLGSVAALLDGRAGLRGGAGGGARRVWPTRSRCPSVDECAGRDRAAQGGGRRPGRAARRRRGHAGQGRPRRPLPDGRALGARRGRRARRTCAPPWCGCCTTWSSRPTWTRPATIVSYAPELRTVTPDGDLLGAYAAAGGSAKAPSFIEVQAAVDEARQQQVRCGVPTRRAAGAARPARGPSRRRARKRSPRPPPRAGRPTAHRNAAGRASWPSWVRPPGRPRPRRTGWPQRRFKAEQARDREPGRPDRPGGPAAAGRVDAARHRSVQRERDRAGRAGARRPPARDRGPARGPYRRGAGRRARPAGPTRWPGRPPPSARPASGPPPAAPPAPAAPRSRQLVVGRRRRRRWPGIAATLAAAAEHRDAVAARPDRRARPSWPRSAARPADSPAIWSGSPRAVHRDEVARAEQRLRIEQLEGKAAEDFGLDVRDAARRVRPARCRCRRPPPRSPRPRPRASRHPSRCRTTGPIQEKRAAQGRARADPAGQGEPARAGGVRRDGGAVQVPLRPARGPQGDPARPAHRRQGRRRADPRGLHAARSRTPRASSSRSSRCCSRAARAGWC